MTTFTEIKTEAYYKAIDNGEYAIEMITDKEKQYFVIYGDDCKIEISSNDIHIFTQALHSLMDLSVIHGFMYKKLNESQN